MLERPTSIGQGRARFDRFADISAAFVGRAAFFATAVVVVVLWMPLIVVFNSVDTWQLVIRTATSVIAFLPIALLTNTERRGDRALHRKLDTVAIAIADLMTSEDDDASRTASRSCGPP